jgi:hypothetical protein
MTWCNFFTIILEFSGRPEALEYCESLPLLFIFDVVPLHNI